jgi:hypothetical protein
MKNARLPISEESSALDSADSSAVKRGFTPRQGRVVDALCSTDGWIFREDIDRIAGASNGPQVIAELRRNWGIDIDMERVDRLDRDGRPCKPGRYRLASVGRQRLASIRGGIRG